MALNLLIMQNEHGHLHVDTTIYFGFQCADYNEANPCGGVEVLY